MLQNCKDRSSRPVVFCKKGVLKALMRRATLLKKGLCHRCFPVNFVKFHLFYRIPPEAVSTGYSILEINLLFAVECFNFSAFVFIVSLVRNAHRRSSIKEGVLNNFAKFTGKHLCQGLFFNKVAGLACNVIKKEILTQMFNCFAKFLRTHFSQNNSGSCFRLVIQDRNKIKKQLQWLKQQIFGRQEFLELRAIGSGRRRSKIRFSWGFRDAVNSFTFPVHPQQYPGGSSGDRSSGDFIFKMTYFNNADCIRFLTFTWVKQIKLFWNSLTKIVKKHFYRFSNFLWDKNLIQ